MLDLPAPFSPTSRVSGLSGNTVRPGPIARKFVRSIRLIISSSGLRRSSVAVADNPVALQELTTAKLVTRSERARPVATVDYLERGGLGQTLGCADRRCLDSVLPCQQPEDALERM